jgi:deoxyribodipyrimidine photolyase-related protein
LGLAQHLNATAGALRLVLADQVSDGLASLRDLDPGLDVVLMAEVRAETDYVPHHKRKIALLFSAMRQFGDRLEERGVTVRYVRLDDAGNTHSIVGEVLRALRDQPYDRVVRTACGEWRLEQALGELPRVTNIEVEVREDDRFLCSRATFANWAEGRAELRMEFFYREMRRETGLLMTAGKPEGGQWNFDKDNRKRPPKGFVPPARIVVPPNPTTLEAIADVERWFPDNFGSLEEFGYPTNPEEAEAVLAHFLTEALPSFGDFQDFMMAGEPFLFHGLISAAMNCGLLDPGEVCGRAEAEYRAGRAPLNAVEGFIRQIIGWREYVRGLYWLKMPEYRLRNALDAENRLPWFYWSGETDMACVRDVVDVTRRYAYAHHIQRLIITGQLAMLLGVHPDEINAWYLVVYADAYEWVELPNTHGMAIYADGGIMASKPYAASGAYINKMSDYCGRCIYDVRERLGPTACPFNALYWDFLIRNERYLAGNRRLGVIYGQIARMDPEHREAITAEAERTRTAFGAVLRDADPLAGTDRPDRLGSG